MPTAGSNQDRTFDPDEQFDFPIQPATGGNAPITTTISGLPAGANFQNNRISGSLAASGIHTITVTYTDADGDSASDTFALIIAPERPAAPQPPSLTATKTTITATWLAPLSTLHITAYEILHYPTTTAVETRVKITSLTHTITGLTPNTAYAVRIRAFAGSIPGPWSDPSTIRTDTQGDTQDPADDRTASVRLDWDKPDDETINLYQYRIKVS